MKIEIDKNTSNLLELIVVCLFIMGMFYMGCGK